MAANQQQGCISIGLQVAGESISRVIGKQGAGLKQIREGTGCKLQVSESTGDTSLPRRVGITGFPQGVGMAVQQALTKIMPDETGQTTVTVFIPPDLAGMVVGKAGANLKRVREFLAVRLELDRDSVVDPTGSPERKVKMTGSWMNMGQALAMALGGAAPLIPFNHHMRAPSTLGVPTPQQGYWSSSSHVPGGSNGIPSLDVRQVSDDPDEIQLHMSVPDKLVGALLGKEGSQIKQVAVMSGCRLHMSKKDLGERRVVFIGKYKHCVIAQRAVQKQLLEAAEQAGIEVSSSSMTLFVRSAVAGTVIGKGGATLKLIRERTGAKVQVGRDEVQGQRPCIISGTNEEVMLAVGMVHDLLNEEGAESLDPSGDDSLATQSAPQQPAPPSPDKAQDLANAKRQKLEGEGATKLLVPAKSAGTVIGKQGSGLARIRELCGVKVEMLQQGQAPHWSDDRAVILQGNYESRVSAAREVLRAAFQADPSAAHLKMLVPNNEAGAVIGKAGATLKMIREKCGISVHMDKHDIFGDRLVSAQGTLPSVVEVAHWVIWSIEGQEELPAPAAGQNQ